MINVLTILTAFAMIVLAAMSNRPVLPNVRLYITEEDGGYYVNIKNMGKSNAYQVRAKLILLEGDDSKSYLYGESFAPEFLNKEISVIPPEQSATALIAPASGFHNKAGRLPVYNVVISYRYRVIGRLFKKIKKMYELDLNMYKGGAAITPNDTNKIVRSIESVGRSISSIENHLSSRREN